VRSPGFVRGGPAVRVEGVSKRFRLYHERNQSLKAALMRGGRAKYDEFWALRDVSFDVPRGSTFGLIGENGSGKSTMLKCIARILQPDAGQIAIDGSVAALLELGSGFHPELSGRENVFLNASILGMRKAEVEKRFDSIVDFAGVRDFIDQPVKNYSSVMYVRLGFSVAINMDPEILLVDEVLAVGDSSFQDKCMEKFVEFRRAGKTVIIVSHAMSSMRTMCDEVAWLDHGKLMSVGEASDLVSDYVDHVHDAVAGDKSDESDGSIRTHWGSGEARIESLDVVDDAGHEVRELPFGSGFTVRMKYRTSTQIDRPVFGLGIETIDGQMLWGSNTREANTEVDIAAGEGLVEFKVSASPLQGSRLALVGSITDHSTTHVYDFVRGELYLNIANVRPIESGGPIALSGTWRHQSLGRVEAAVRA